jgi:hypothetical protein
MLNKVLDPLPSNINDFLEELQCLSIHLKGAILHTLMFLTHENAERYAVIFSTANSTQCLTRG